MSRRRLSTRPFSTPAASWSEKAFAVTYLDPGSNGLVTPEAVKDALRDDTILVSIMHANNEIGTVNDIAGIGEVTRAAGVLFHVDAAQSAGKGRH